MQPRVAQPAPRRGAVERRRSPARAPPSLMRRSCSRYSSGPERERARPRQVRAGLDVRRRRRASACGEGRRSSLLDLLLEERVHHDRRRAGVLEPPHRVEVVDQRRRARHERVRQRRSPRYVVERSMRAPRVEAAQAVAARGRLRQRDAGELLVDGEAPRRLALAPPPARRRKRCGIAALDHAEAGLVRACTRAASSFGGGESSTSGGLPSATAAGRSGRAARRRSRPPASAARRRAPGRSRARCRGCRR